MTQYTHIFLLYVFRNDLFVKVLKVGDIEINKLPASRDDTFCGK